MTESIGDDWVYGDRLENIKTGALVMFEKKYVPGMFKYKNRSQSNIIGHYDRFRLDEKAPRATVNSVCKP